MSSADAPFPGRQHPERVDLDFGNFGEIVGHLGQPHQTVNHRLAVRGWEAAIAGQSAPGPGGVEQMIGF